MWTKGNRPILYQTTKEFLTFFGLSSLDELPPLSDGDIHEAMREADLFFSKYEEDEEETNAN